MSTISGGDETMSNAGTNNDLHPHVVPAEQPEQSQHRQVSIETLPEDMRPLESPRASKRKSHNFHTTEEEIAELHRTHGQDRRDAIQRKIAKTFERTKRKGRTMIKKLNAKARGKTYEESSDEEEEQPRVIIANDRDYNSKQGFAANKISTTKYSFITFIPKNLFEQFRRAANFYFLVVAIVQMIPGITPISPVTSILPLVFVLGVTAVKEFIEDLGRRRMDEQINGSKVEIIRDGEVKEIRWSSLQVGDIVKSKSGQHFPADMILLSSADPTGSCYIETSNLDGETNLKIRESIKETRHVNNVEEASKFKAIVECEQPNNKLYRFHGLIKIGGKKYSLSAKQLLLRGCMLRNTEWVYGLVVFTGHETKLMKNSTNPPSKRTHLEKQMDKLILILFGTLGVMCFISAILGGIWTATNHDTWYLKGLSSPPTVGALGFLVFLILYNTFIPISLYVYMEVVKVVHAYFINQDVKMYDPNTNTPAKARTSNLGEELGQVHYVFSDKTGTLTQNRMEFLKCSIAGEKYGTGTTEIGRAAAMRSGKVIHEEPRPDNLVLERGTNFYDQKINFGAWKTQPNAQTIRDFFTLLAVCHTVIPEKDPNDPTKIKYQAASPDEEALVVAAKNLGFFFHTRTREEVIVNIDGVDHVYRILNILEFDSDRKRMSVIVQCPDDKIRLMCKGADTVIYKRLREQDKPTRKRGVEAENENEGEDDEREDTIADITMDHLEEYGDEGLRTLCLSQVVLDEEEYEEWAQIYHEAATSNFEREKKINAAAELIEKNLELLGATAIEDKLQDGVPECIELLSKANIKIWVLTGDKQETAINIGFACSLLHNDMSLIIISGTDMEEVTSELTKAAEECKRLQAMNTDIGIIITGEALGYALKKELRAVMLELAMMSKAFICCRVSPLQKAQVVKLVKNNVKDVVTLAIGDGANDVSMIQAAHIGIGISGHEGMQAVMASDFAIAQFSFLSRLLLVHGHWDYTRVSKLILYCFMKNITFTVTQFWFAIFSGFSGMTYHESWHMSLYNVIFTCVPILVLAMLDQDIPEETIINNPRLYIPGQRYQEFNIWTFILWMLDGLYQSAICFVIPYFTFGGVSNWDGRNFGLWILGTVTYTCVVIVVNARLALEVHTWNPIIFLAIALSILAWFVFSFVYNSLPIKALLFIGQNSLATHMYHVIWQICATFGFWVNIVLTTAAALVPSFIAKYIIALRERAALARQMRALQTSVIVDDILQDIGTKESSKLMEPLEEQEAEMLEISTMGKEAARRARVKRKFKKAFNMAKYANIMRMGTTHKGREKGGEEERPLSSHNTGFAYSQQPGQFPTTFFPLSNPMRPMSARGARSAVGPSPSVSSTTTADDSSNLLLVERENAFKLVDEDDDYNNSDKQPQQSHQQQQHVDRPLLNVVEPEITMAREIAESVSSPLADDAAADNDNSQARDDISEDETEDMMI